MQPALVSETTATPEALTDLDLEIVAGGKVVIADLLFGRELRAIGARFGAEAGANIGRSLGS